ncbi:MAG TPA: hypothetical protein IAB12_03070 [Candidatus Ornithospirochaeta avicola]|uniref:Lipoprotein n=1 Tax=Candidatus Ornithospirochaeta avicola TaxID=2840896 RepID=A0A9D1TNB4_9SPIO|nr:hypothetical protein [Candidatus Ornithospirochaeta avicola]
MKKLFVALLVLLSILAISCDGNTKTPDAPAVNTTGTDFLKNHLLEGKTAEDAIFEINDIENEMPNDNITMEGMTLIYNGFEKIADGNDAIKGGTKITIWGKVSQTSGANLTVQLDNDVFTLTAEQTEDPYNPVYKINGVDISEEY